MTSRSNSLKSSFRKMGARLGSNCVPAQRSISASTSLRDSRVRYVRVELHRVERISEGDQPRDHRDVLAREAVWVPDAVPPLVVVQHAGQDVAELGDVLEDAVPDLGMLADPGVLLVGELARLQQHVLGHADLADVVHETGDVHARDRVLVESHRTCELLREHRDALRVTAGVPVLGVDRRGECLERAEEHRGQVLVQRRVLEEDRGVARRAPSSFMSTDDAAMSSPCLSAAINSPIAPRSLRIGCASVV